MSWRTIVISNNAKLDYQMGYLVVRGTEITKIHLGEIGMIIVETTAVSLTVSLLAELTAKKIKVIFCDQKRNPSSELVPYYGSHDTSMKIRNQIKWDDDIKTAVWTEVVSDKIRKQCDVLREYELNEAALLEKYIQELEFGDATNREGHAAKVYFNALFGMDFNRTKECNTNAALNYGYSLILSCFTREISANGYLSQLGLFHDNMFNPFNLASDLMEPFRPLIDRKVKTMDLEMFEKQEKHDLINVLNSEVLIHGRIEYVTNAIKIYCKSVFDAINDKDVSLIKFYELQVYENICDV